MSQQESKQSNEQFQIVQLMKTRVGQTTLVGPKKQECVSKQIRRSGLRALQVRDRNLLIDKQESAARTRESDNNAFNHSGWHALQVRPQFWGRQMDKQITMRVADQCFRRV